MRAEQLITGERWFHQSLRSLLLIFQWITVSALAALTANASATVINASFVPIGSQWRVDYSVINTSLPSLEEFTLFFDHNIVRGVSTGGLSNWDMIVVQPDPLIPDDGFIDGLAQGFPLANGAMISFSVLLDATVFEVALPQRYEIRDPHSFALLDAGYTVATAVPEPSIGFLMLLGLFLLVVRARRLCHVDAISWNTVESKPSTRSPAYRKRTFRIVVFIIVIVATALANAGASPVVEGMELVSSKRISRTVFEYAYRLRVQADQYNYSNSRFIASVKNGSTGTSVIQGVVNIGALGAGDFVRPAPLLVIRHDRLEVFDPKVLELVFRGSVEAAKNSDGTISIGAVSLLQESGRPGHGGTLNIAGSPEAGKAYILMADVYKAPISVSYKLTSINGADIYEQGSMSSIGGSDFQYAAQMFVPQSPFIVEIQATAGDGKQTKRQSGPFNPAKFAFAITGASALIRRGESQSLTMEISSPESPGQYVINALAPVGINVVPSNWVVEAGAGAPRKLSGVIYAEPSAALFKRSRIIFTVAPLSAVNDTKQYSQQITVY